MGCLEATQRTSAWPKEENNCYGSVKKREEPRPEVPPNIMETKINCVSAILSASKPSKLY